MSEYKITFNYLLSHKVMPQVFFSSLDFFYKEVITSPQGMQQYMKYAMEQAANFVKKNPKDIEPPFEVEEFDMGILGESPETGVIIIVIPNCKELNDCSVIAIPCMREYARYFTCELSNNPLTEEKFYIAGEWKPDGESFTHSNYGQIDFGEDFISKVIKIVYGVDYDPSEKSEAVNKDESEDKYLKDLSEIAGEGWAAFKNNDLDKALDAFNKLLDEEQNQAIFYHCRAEIHKKIANNKGNIINNFYADYDMFRAKMLDLRGLDPYSKTHEEIGLEKRTELFETEGMFDILQNSEGKMLFCIKKHEGDVRLPELFYSGGKNALLRRRMDQYIVLDEIHENARDELCKIDEVLITETENGVVKEYTVPVCHLSEIIDLDTVEDILEDGYLLFASLASFARELTEKGKTIKEIIKKDDYSNLAAVLAREEDYDLLQKYIDEGLPLNDWVSHDFKDWRPTPLFYITTKKIWSEMKEPAKMLAFLVKNGADPNIESAEGDTPVLNQCFPTANTEILKALLEAGADPNLDCTTSEGVETLPIIAALCPSEYNEETKKFQPIIQNQVEIVKLLIEAGADVNCTIALGVRPLSLVITYGTGVIRQELIKYLCEKGADVDLALKGMENSFNEGILEYGYALYEFYSGLIRENPMPEISKWQNKETGKSYLEKTANEGYLQALKVLGANKPPKPTGRYIHSQAVELFSKGKTTESFALFKEAFLHSADFNEAALLPMPVSDYFKEFCQNKGWQVYQRLSINGKLLPLLLIGNRKVVVTLESNSAAVEILSKAAEGIKANYQNLVKEGEPKEIEVIPAELIFAQDKIKTSEVVLLNMGAIFGNKVEGITDFEDFIEKMGQQEEMPQNLNDMIHVSVIAIIDGEENEEEAQDEYEDSKYDGEI